MPEFQLHRQLETDASFVIDLPLSQCRLINNQNFPWLLLIPRLANAVELIDLSIVDQQQLLLEVNIVAKVLRHEFPCDKLNIATLGNMVPQLHVHVIARVKNDIVWPNPVWGSACTPYSPELLQNQVMRLKTAIDNFKKP